MSDSVVATRYAVALFQLGQEKSILEQLEKEVRTVREVFEANSKLSEFLKQPKIAIEKKKEFLKEAFQGASKELLNTLYIMLDRHREDAIPSMTQSFIDMTNEVYGIADAEAYSARALTDSEKDSLQKVFAEKLGFKSLRITNIVDSTVLGGVKLKIGNKIYDGTVSGKLERMERKLVSVNY
ncbi:F-type H+-transporting ATPase subunit delta [Salirhabdus euzebyi]|uniref:ATP synthase subunit delta n=1 Tax=Salirhabdus euzebyi TaxID=394506 RepID=A0A841Q6B5_9BACI|nr:F0F1 ATP synthase subunit delta [Salirhabdus euzebyi]MBB6453960.1 F-type H+-transporting ATPase subunit delta [Salirhabdus euzebyi]